MQIRSDMTPRPKSTWYDWILLLLNNPTSLKYTKSSRFIYINFRESASRLREQVGPRCNGEKDIKRGRCKDQSNREDGGDAIGEGRANRRGDEIVSRCSNGEFPRSGNAWIHHSRPQLISSGHVAQSSLDSHAFLQTKKKRCMLSPAAMKS
jgi:hypothetical protein